MPAASLTISSKNYSSWCLRGWLLCKMAGLDFEESIVSIDDASVRAELLLLSPSFLVPCLEHEGAKIWDTLAIAEYLAEWNPAAGLLPSERLARAHCRSVSGEMHSGFFNLRSALPMNLRARYPGFKIFAGALPDIARITQIWRDCLQTYGGPFLFDRPSIADAHVRAGPARAFRPMTFPSTRRRRPIAKPSTPGRRWSPGPRRRRPSPTTSTNSTPSSDNGPTRDRRRY